MKFLLLLALLLPIRFAHSEETPLILKEEVPLKVGVFQGKTTLTLNKTKVKAGEEFGADIRFLNKGGGHKFFNPFLNTLMPRPAELAIFDSKKKYVGNLLATFDGSHVRGETDQDWTYIASSAYVGKEYNFRLGYANGIQYFPYNDLSQTSLPVGVYYLQVIYNSAFISRDFSDYNRDFFRSNVVEIQLTD